MVKQSPASLYKTASPGAIQGGDHLECVQGNIQLQDASLDNTPEELNPLKQALERALLHKDEAAGIREALEAEVWHD